MWSTKPGRFDRFTLEIVGDEQGFVSGSSPQSFGGVDDEGLGFHLSLRGTVASSGERQLFAVGLRVWGDESVVLDESTLIIEVPAR